ncbi:hypothetical protein DOY81_013069 [Sarcophaga bullata]|nr:hypothetical protein DOY81_013069 [Sarcophaga bullata]
MEFKKQQMEFMHSMCQNELKNLQMNLQNFLRESEHSQKVLSEVILNGNTLSLCAFHRYMSQLTTICNMARKFNIYLQINSLHQTVIGGSSSSSVCLDEDGINLNRMLNDFIELNNAIFENGLVSGNDITPRPKTNLELATKEDDKEPESINVLESTEELLKFLLPEKCLDSIEIGGELEAYIVNTNNYQNLEFFICQTDDYKTLFDLSRNKNFNRIPNLSLPSRDVFCVLEKDNDSANNCIWRAIRVPQKEEEENNKCKDLVYLIDFGENIMLTEDCAAYVVPQHYKEIPPLAVKCKLEGIENTFLKITERDRKKCEQFLQKNEFKKLTFRVIQKKSNVLHVVVLDFSKDLENVLSTKSGNNYKFNPFEDYNKSSADEDQDQTNLSVLNISNKVGDKIKIMVTHVISPISFYAIIQNDLFSGCGDFSWHENLVYSTQRCISPPQINDIVLSQYYKDNYFYRAKVIDADRENDRYKVFYVDFGNTETVSLRSLAQCWKEQLEYPFRAVLFHLANISLLKLYDDKILISSHLQVRFQNAMENVMIMILDQILNVQIKEKRGNEFFIVLLDEQYDGIPNMLINMGVVTEL